MGDKIISPIVDDIGEAVRAYRQTYGDFILRDAEFRLTEADYQELLYAPEALTRYVADPSGAHNFLN